MSAATSKTKTTRTSRPAKKKTSPLDDLDCRSILLEAAAKVGDDEVALVVRKAGKIAAMAKNGALSVWSDDIRDLLALITDYAGGRYRHIPFGSVAAITGALLYVLSPLDLIPDVIPGVGYLDDAGVIASCLKLVRLDLQRYRAHRKA